MTVAEWVEKIGITRAAKSLNVAPGTVYFWVDRETLPKPETMLKIVKQSKGQVCLIATLEDFVKHNR